MTVIRDATAAVYTAVMGQYERPQLPTDIDTTGVDLICFTDDPELKSSRWNVVYVDAAYRGDRIRSARRLKVLGHPTLHPYTRTLWIDNRVSLKLPPVEILDSWLKIDDFAAPIHSFHPTVRDEFRAVIADRLDDPHRVREQRMNYEEHYGALLDSRPYWTALLARRRVDSVEVAMMYWMDQILRFSRRDQLSLNVALWSSNTRAFGVMLDNLESEVHVWLPVSEMHRSQVTSRFGRPSALDHFQYGWKDRLSDAISTYGVTKSIQRRIGRGAR